MTPDDDAERLGLEELAAAEPDEPTIDTVGMGEPDEPDEADR